MITSLVTSLFRVTLAWYAAGLLVLFLGKPAWAEEAYRRLLEWNVAPAFKLEGLTTAAQVQWNLLAYWTLPVLGLWVVLIAVGAGAALLKVGFRKKTVASNIKPQGEFVGVRIPPYSLGALLEATTPKLQGPAVRFSSDGPQLGGASSVVVEVRGAIKDAVALLSPEEKALAQELLQLLNASPDHFAGLGHGVGLLEHTLNVLSEAAPKCTAEFRLPFLAALAHDIGKLITFIPDGQGGWTRKGLHTREGARILAALPAFARLPALHRDALLLAVKYDHAPSKMPYLRGEREPSLLAMRIISALSAADKTATAAEKERHLERLAPEDLLWLDFVGHLRDARVVQKGATRVANQVNNPPGGKFLCIYEAPWRDEAVARLPAEVAAALDLHRRDTGKVAKYTHILAQRLKKEGLLVTEHDVETSVDGKVELSHQTLSEAIPLWDIWSGDKEKGVEIRGVLVLKAEPLWRVLNYRLGTQSPYPVKLLRPTTQLTATKAKEPKPVEETPPVVEEGPVVAAGMKAPDLDSKKGQEEVGLGPAGVKPKYRAKDKEPARRKKTGLEGAIADKKAEGVKPPADVKNAQPESVPPTQTLAGEEAEGATDEAPWAAAGPQGEASFAVALDFLAEAGALTVSVQEEAQNVSEQDGAQEAALEPMAGPAEALDGSEGPEASPKALQEPADATTAGPAPAPAAPPAESEPVEQPPATLTKSEVWSGVAFADAAACAAYPELSIGDKYYTKNASEVIAGRAKEGAKYSGALGRAQPKALKKHGPERGRFPAFEGEAKVDALESKAPPRRKIKH